jgi:diguanylate cyclase (GGDEF)-like protein/PAS domain S-box-containing protein
MSKKTPLTEDTQFYSELLRAYFDSTDDAIFVLCDEMKFLTCNKMTERWLGYTEHELTLHNQRTPITRLLGKDYDIEKFNFFFNSVLQGKSISFETRINPPQGSERWIDISLAKVDIENGDMIIAVARDISERKKHLATIDYQTQFDALTGLPNRTSIVEYLQDCQNNPGNKPCNLVLMAIDIDRFKEINESFGQQVGDFILQEIARRLQRITDLAADEFLARLGGDEFALAIPDINIAQARVTAQTIRQIILQPITLETGKISLDCGIGIAAMPDHTEDSNQLIQLAEAAMYNAKSEKLGVSVYNPELSLTATERLQLITDLREALSANDIRPHYQPIVNMQTNSIHVEALARWQHPRHGYIAPEVFIHLAEETGLINTLTSQIMETAFRECAPALLEQSIENLSINLSPYCLSNTKLPDEIEAYLKRYAIPAQAITLELTESAIMSNLSATQTTIQSLEKLGLAFSIDDFGTGYSSLSKLKQMTLKELKIDKTFILDICKSEDDAAITNASIQMAHGLGLDVVAEGIENEATWNILRQMGCDYGQGFWLGKPMPFDELIQWAGKSSKLL